MSLRIRLLPRAQSDISGTYHYIIAASPEGAKRWRYALEASLEEAAAFPERFGFAPENELVKYELRQVLFKTKRGRRYRAVFTVIGAELIVLRIRGTGQPPLQHGDIRTD